MGRGHGGKGGGYDWRQHIRPSDDQAVQTRVRGTIQGFLDNPQNPRELELWCHGPEKNTYTGFNIRSTSNSFFHNYTFGLSLAVSTPTFASKYSIQRIFPDLNLANFVNNFDDSSAQLSQKLGFQISFAVFRTDVDEKYSVRAKNFETFRIKLEFLDSFLL